MNKCYASRALQHVNILLRAVSSGPASSPICDIANASKSFLSDRSEAPWHFSSYYNLAGQAQTCYSRGPAAFIVPADCWVAVSPDQMLAYVAQISSQIHWLRTDAVACIHWHHGHNGAVIVQVGCGW